MKAEDEIDALKAEIARLKGDNFMECPIAQHLARKLNLTRIQARFVAILFTRGLVSKRAMHAALYNDPEGGPDPKIIDIHLCHIRQKLSGSGIAIETIFGAGLRITSLGTARLAELLNEARAEMDEAFDWIKGVRINPPGYTAREALQSLFGINATETGLMVALMQGGVPHAKAREIIADNTGANLRSAINHLRAKLPPGFDIQSRDKVLALARLHEGFE